MLSKKREHFDKITSHPLFAQIDGWIREGKSPHYISLWLRNEYPTQPKMQIDHTELYRYRKIKYPDLASKPSRSRRSVTASLEVDLATKIMALQGKTPLPPMKRKKFTDEQLLGWCNGFDGFVKFAEEICYEMGKPISLQDYQVEAVNLFEKNSRVCICTGGQVGKDFLIQRYSLWKAIVDPGSLQMIICATQPQADECMLRTLGIINTSEDLNYCVAATKIRPQAELIFKNGSRILYLTAKSLLAGFTNVKYIYVNEARDIREEEITRVSPLLGIAEGSLFVFSRPRFRRGYFYECFVNPLFKTMKIPTEQNKFFSKKVLEDDRATLSPDLFKIEYLGEFADVGSAYFSEASVDNCSKSDYDFTSMVTEPEWEYALGIDWARLRDTSVFMVIGKHIHTGKKKIFHIFSFSPDENKPITFEHQLSYARLLQSRFDFQFIIPESSGMGIPLCERLIDDWKQIGNAARVVPYENRSLESKLEMYDEAKRVVESGEIEGGIPRRAYRLINELKMTQFGTTKHGAISIETPITDDFADCFCLALMAFKKPFKMGVAVIQRRIPRPFNVV